MPLEWLLACSDPNPPATTTQTTKLQIPKNWWSILRQHWGHSGPVVRMHSKQKSPGTAGRAGLFQAGTTHRLEGALSVMSWPGEDLRLVIERSSEFIPKAASFVGLFGPIVSTLPPSLWGSETTRMSQYLLFDACYSELLRASARIQASTPGALAENYDLNAFYSLAVHTLWFRNLSFFRANIGSDSRNYLHVPQDHAGGSAMRKLGSHCVHRSLALRTMKADYCFRTVHPETTMTWHGFLGDLFDTADKDDSHSATPNIISPAHFIHPLFEIVVQHTWQFPPYLPDGYLVRTRHVDAQKMLS
ncbi:hypothetical protein C8R46DRAFT_1302114 [Mycena filopes]|nr:hypothetical protein C8R46DRAFT_1302114 [Mycena filopes]